MRTRLHVAVAISVIALAGCGTTTSPVPVGTPALSASPSMAVSPAPTSAITTAPTSLPQGATTVAAKLLSPLDGWALTDEHLVVTEDGGLTWRVIAPPVSLAGEGVLGVAFADPLHGWVAHEDPAYGRVDVWRTTDGGQSWRKVLLPPAVVNRYSEAMGHVARGAPLNG